MEYSKLYQSLLAVGILAFTSATFALNKTSDANAITITAAMQSSTTPQQAFQYLKDGNKRFVEGKMKHRDLLAQANITSYAQHPLVIVLNCIDSRSSPELIFDQGIGDIFATRLVGNVQNDDVLGGMEYGTKFAGAKLIAVIGHSNCGAIRGACQQTKLGHLTGLLQRIQPAIEQASKELNTTDCSDHAFIDQIAKDNVLMVMKQIQTRSPVIADLIKQGKLGIVGGIQDLATGRVTFFEDQSIMPK